MSATLSIRLALFMFLVLFVVEPFAEIAWFHAKGPVGDREREFTVIITMDSVPLYKGSYRQAPTSLPGQTYEADKFTIEAQYQAPDTSFVWNTTITSRQSKPNESIPELIGVNTVRSGLGDNEWTRVNFRQQPLVVEFHSPIYGDGQHELDVPAVPEELFPTLARTAFQQSTPMQLRMMASMWEMPYSRRQFVVKVVPTEQRLKIDDVEAALIRFERDDGAIGEVWLSVKGLRILRMRTFRGLWMERIQ